MNREIRKAEKGARWVAWYIAITKSNLYFLAITSAYTVKGKKAIVNNNNLILRCFPIIEEVSMETR